MEDCRSAADAGTFERVGEEVGEEDKQSWAPYPNSRHDEWVAFAVCLVGVSTSTGSHAATLLQHIAELWQLLVLDVIRLFVVAF